MKNFFKKYFEITNYREIEKCRKYKIIRIFNKKIKIRVKYNEQKYGVIKNLYIENNNQDYISIAAIYKNEPDIIEWIEYHKLIGVTRFYLYDNESTDNSKELLKPYIDDGTVIYHYVNGKCQQIPAYNDAIHRYADRTKWLAFIDLDEYILPVKSENLVDIIKEYEEYCGVGINWCVFDSNGLEKRPDKLVIEAYTRKVENRCIKSIVNPRKVKVILNPHYAYYIDDELAVNTDKKYIGDKGNFKMLNRASTNYYSDNILKINHYHTKSKEDYLRKIGIGFADQNNPRKFDEKKLNFESADFDYTIQKYLPQLKQVLEKR